MNCIVCNKSNYMNFLCKCGYYTCIKHRYASEHDCKYDYKKNAKEQISKNNPVIVADKINKI
jgi:hypothetical protein